MSDASYSSTTKLRRAPASVYLLAENLDAALAAGEDLADVYYAWSGSPPREAEQIAGIRSGQRKATEKMRTLEFALLSRTLKARDWASDLGAREHSFSHVARLYVAVTADLAEAAADYGNASANDFETGKDPTAYLRSRGLIAEDAAALDDMTPIAVDDTFRVAGRVTLGALLNLVSTFLDALEIEFDLFVEDGGNHEADLKEPAIAPPA